MQNDWQKAYEFRGRGSSEIRANVINEIYNKTVPIPEEVLSDEKMVFIGDIVNIIKDTIREFDSKIESVFP